MCAYKKILYIVYSVNNRIVLLLTNNYFIHFLTFIIFNLKIQYFNIL